MKKLFLILISIFLFSTLANAADITVAWDANTEATLAGYNVHWSTSNQIPFSDSADVQNTTKHTITGLTEDMTYFIAATAYDSAGNESAYSDILEVVVRAGRVVIRVLDRPTSIRYVFD